MIEKFGGNYQWNPATLRTFVRRLGAYGGSDAGLRTPEFTRADNCCRDARGGVEYSFRSWIKFPWPRRPTSNPVVGDNARGGKESDTKFAVDMYISGLGDFIHGDGI
jgi:hypothetical protein